MLSIKIMSDLRCQMCRSEIKPASSELACILGQGVLFYLIFGCFVSVFIQKFVICNALAFAMVYFWYCFSKLLFHHKKIFYREKKCIALYSFVISNLAKPKINYNYMPLD